MLRDHDPKRSTHKVTLWSPQGGGPCGLAGAGSNIGVQTLSYIYKVTIGAQVNKINFYFFSTKVLGSLKPSFKKVSSVPLLTDKSKFEARGGGFEAWKRRFSPFCRLTKK